MRQFALWAGLLALPFLLLSTQLHWGKANEPAAFDYPPTSANACHAAPDPQLSEPALPSFHVRTPANYQPTQAHPLLVVFSPAGANSHLTERWVGITHEATRRGIVVAYVSSIRLSPAAIPLLAQQVRFILKHWCIDPTRVTFSGHSDGGTVAQLLALLRYDTPLSPTTIVASGAGLLKEDFADFRCPRGTHVMLYHGSNDNLFPGYGRSAAQAWAQCMRCGDARPTPDGCMTYGDCDGSLRYCEVDASHYRWLPDTTDLLRSVLENSCQTSAPIPGAATAVPVSQSLTEDRGTHPEPRA